MSTVYPSIRAARAALALDHGVDPFISGGWGRPTKAKLAAAGYPVDPAECRRRAREQEEMHRREVCRECGERAARDLLSGQPTGLCPKHTAYDFVCERGHRWQATDEQDVAAGHRCPTCGDYWV